MNHSTKLNIVETTLASEKNLSLDQKIELAKQLEKLNVDVIEIPANNNELASELASIINIKVAASALLSKDDIDRAGNILKDFKEKRLRLILAPEVYTDFDIESVEVKKDLLKMVKDSISYTKTLVDDVELIIIKNHKLHDMFIYRIIETAIDLNTSTITVTDNDGTLMSCEYGKMINNTIYNLPEFENSTLGASTKETIGLATSNALAAIYNGATQIDVNLINIGYNASLGDILKAFKARKDLFNIETNLNYDELQPVYQLFKDCLNI